LTSIKICTDRAQTYVRGTQVSYGKFNGIGEIIDAVSLTAFGDLDQATSLCKNFYIPNRDYLTNINMRYNLSGVSLIQLTTANGQDESFGQFTFEDSLFTQSFSKLDNFFFGFQGRLEKNEGTPGLPNDHLLSLGIVSYNYDCLFDEKERQGKQFLWGIETYQLSTGTTTSTASTVTTNTQANGGAVSTVSGNAVTDDSSSDSFNFEDDLEDWEKIVAYITFGLNVFFIMLFSVYTIFRFCIGNPGGKGPMEAMVLTSTFDRSENVQMANQVKAVGQDP